MNTSDAKDTLRIGLKSGSIIEVNLLDAQQLIKDIAFADDTSAAKTGSRHRFLRQLIGGVLVDLEEVDFMMIISD